MPKSRAPRWALAAALLAAASLYLLDHAERPPRHPDDLCSMFSERRSWYRGARQAAERWGVSEGIQLAIIFQESSFRARVRPPRRKILWILPGPRPSSAYGYAQVVDSTWQQFRDRTGRSSAKRHRFADVAHFVAWYGDEIHRLTGIPKDDPYRLYLAYHEGPAGYARGSHLQKPWLLDVARRVETRARTYERQHAACAERLRRQGGWRWPLAVGALLLAVFLLRLWVRKRRPRRRKRRTGRGRASR